MKTTLSLLLAFSAVAFPLVAADMAPEDKPMLAKFEKELAALDATLANGSGTVAQFSRRGDLRVFLMKFEDAVADYEKMVELDPTLEAHHWRLGITYYLSGDFEKAAKQFEKFYEVDKSDRETGLWHFLANAGLESIQAAQSKMLRYNEDTRPPFPQLYELFAAGGETQSFFRDLYDEGMSTKPDVMFYARLYAGIYEEVNGRSEQAAKFIRMAYESAWGRKANGGPGYMWQIARILATAPAEEPAEKKDGEKKEDEKK